MEKLALTLNQKAALEVLSAGPLSITKTAMLMSDVLERYVTTTSAQTTLRCLRRRNLVECVAEGWRLRVREEGESDGGESAQTTPVKGEEAAPLTLEQWRAEGRRRFGADGKKWRFVCPVCGHVASVQDWLDAGAPEGAAAFSCVGRYLPDSRDAFEGEGDGPCNYAGGGLFALNPVAVVGEDGVTHNLFAFAEV